MDGKFALDTNIVVSYFNADPKTLEKFDRAKRISIPCIVMGELYFGAFKSARVEFNLARIETFRLRSSILNCNLETSFLYGKIKDKLRRRGSPIPDNDIWIAALSMQYNLTLVTRDAHFKEVDGLAIEEW